MVKTGNTVIDALFYSTEKIHQGYRDNEIEEVEKQIDPDKKLILVTAHRRENHGEGFERICRGLKTIAKRNPDVQLVYPVHLNPNVQKPVYKHLNGIDNIKLISPLNYPAFVNLMERCHFVITDSGGIQEEAPGLGKPVLVMRDVTERPEAVEAGTVKLVGADAEKICTEAEKLICDEKHYQKMSKTHNPYGDGKACERIFEFLKNRKLN
jgi:UDP-N-acetylglucosamine 2-epimerase (non-hydrolysing)